MIRSFAVVVLLAGCASRAAPPSSAAPAETATAAPAPACLADELPPLRDLVGTLDCRNNACIAGCDAGDGRACFHHAQTLAVDPATSLQAEPFFLRACRLGEAIGCTNHAAFRWLDDDSEASVACSLRVFELSCAAGEDWACGMIGRLLLKRGQGDDLERGRLELERTCAALDGFPCFILAVSLDDGVLPGGDPVRIQALKDRACASGVPMACGAGP